MITTLYARRFGRSGRVSATWWSRSGGGRCSAPKAGRRQARPGTARFGVGGPALLVAVLAGTLLGVAIIARRGVAAGRKTAVPFGPFLALGGLVGLFAGQAIVHGYLKAVGL